MVRILTHGSGYYCRLYLWITRHFELDPRTPKPTRYPDFLLVENYNDGCVGRHELQLPIILFEAAYSVFRDSAKSKWL